MRHFLGTRYDARSGVFDWDYHMRLLDLVREIIELFRPSERRYCLRERREREREVSKGVISS